jgi:hypothetical protein
MAQGVHCRLKARLQARVVCAVVFTANSYKNGAVGCRGTALELCGRGPVPPLPEELGAPCSPLPLRRLQPPCRWVQTLLAVLHCPAHYPLALSSTLSTGTSKVVPFLGHYRVLRRIE